MHDRPAAYVNKDSILIEGSLIKYNRGGRNIDQPE